MVETREVVRTVCPPELDAPPAERPAPEPGAVVQYNPAGGRFLAALTAWAEGLARRLSDGRAECDPARVGSGGPPGLIGGPTSAGD